MCCRTNRELLRKSLVASQPVASQPLASQSAVNPVAVRGVRPSPAPDVPAPRSDAEEVVFEFRGSDAFIAIGGATGRRYLFSGPGTRVRVDARERELLAMIDGLVEVNELDAAV